MARVQKMTIGAATSVHTPAPDRARLIAVAAPRPVETMVTSASGLYWSRRMSSTSGTAANGVAR